MSFNIAIDGPAGAGKSTIARRAAKELSFLYVDTGAMYRTIALAILRKGVGPEQEEAVRAVLSETIVSIGYEDGEQQVYLNGENVSGLIRTEEVSELTSRVAALPQVRERLKDLQQDLAARENVLMDGRDIGTAILPHAQLKIYLTASVKTRAERRFLELRGKGEDCSLPDIEKEIEERDYRDMHRSTAPLCQAADAVRIDSSHLTIEEVTERIVALARARLRQGR